MNNQIKSLTPTNKSRPLTEQFQIGHLDYAEPLSPKQVSEGFFHGKLSYSTVLRLAKTGELPFHKIGQKYFTWRKALEDWRDKNNTVGGDLN